LRMSEVIAEVTDAERQRIAVLSGPNLAKEIAVGQPAATVVACVDQARAEAVQRACYTGYFRPYTNTDVVGCEIGGACKNVIALAVTLGPEPVTLAGLAGVGDLVATCTSPLSRNRSFGHVLGAGGSMEAAQQATHGQVAEGVKSCTSVRALAAAHDVEMPLT